MGPVQALRVGFAFVPVTYASARQAGLDRTQAMRVVTVSVSAAALALQRHPGRRHQQNAVRHFVWQAWLSAHLAEEIRPMPLPEALDVLAGYGDELWRHGRLWTAADGHLGHSP